MFTLKEAIFKFYSENICLKYVANFFILFAKFYIHKKKFCGSLTNFQPLRILKIQEIKKINK
ncbi:hypothetical protein LDENG_00231320 [Lucifuga dentata]|nr:hypothetical protein LDENG_00231320 [Lucifuga dentata]